MTGTCGCSMMWIELWMRSVFSSPVLFPWQSNAMSNGRGGVFLLLGEVQYSRLK
jgi:hypothetical protein